MMKTAEAARVMLNVYPDSIGENLGDLLKWLENPTIKDVFQNIYILPSLFHSDLDRGFSVIDYDLNESLASESDLKKLSAMGISLKLDFVLNHMSVQSKQFNDILTNGDKSQYNDFFIDWNKFWLGCGTMTESGYIQPDSEYLDKMHFRKSGLPLLMVKMCNGQRKPYWNTFYQEVVEKNGVTQYRGQMDLNVKSSLVWEFYDETLRKLSYYGAYIVRLDAFAYTAKEPGARNFLNDPDTWTTLEQVRKLADKYNLQLLPEIHAEYREKVHERLAEEGYMIYDFFLPGLIIHALEKKECKYLLRWILDILENGMKTVNMLGCHDGIPLLDLRGLLPDDEINDIIDVVVDRGGYVKDLQGNKKMYYQVNATYYSALGESDDKLLLSRAIQMFMPGIPQVWYLDLVGGTNDYEAVRSAGEGGHKEINRTNLSLLRAMHALNEDVVSKQIDLLRLRNDSPAFGDGAKLTVKGDGAAFIMQWENGEHIARLDADLKTCEFSITT